MMAGDHDRDFVDVACAGRWVWVNREGQPRHDASSEFESVSTVEEDPVSDWLQIDLGLRFPIHMIQYAASMAAEVSASSDGVIAFSDDGRTWSRPEITPQTACEGEAAMLVTAGEASWTRHIRIRDPRLPRSDEAAIRVWSERAILDLIVQRKLLKSDFDIVAEKPGQDVYRAYRLISSPQLQGRSLVGIALYENGAFGNFIIQCLLAVGIARRLNLKYIKMSIMDRSEVLDLKGPTEIGGITFLPAHDPLPTDGYFLSGMFFDVKVQQLAGELKQKQSRWIINNYIRPLFSRLPRTFSEKPDDQLLIHIRSGDIFSTWVAPHYPQPPLAFYKLVIQRLVSEGKISSIKMVFENRLNPVIAEVEAYIAQIGLPVTTQSGTLADDVAALVNGRYLVFGLGTFGPGVCHLSDHVEEVFFFASGWPQHFRGIPTIGKITEVIDVAGEYTKVGEWDNSPERRQLMIDYPIDKLAFEDRMP